MILPPGPLAGVSRTSGLYVLIVDFLPFRPLGVNVLLGFSKRSEISRSFHPVARLASGHLISRFAASTLSVSVDVIDSHNHPILEAFKTVQSAILALEVVSFEDFHRLLTRHLGNAAEKESMKRVERHGSLLLRHLQMGRCGLRREDPTGC